VLDQHTASKCRPSHNASTKSLNRQTLALRADDTNFYSITVFGGTGDADPAGMSRKHQNAK
jgi:hypothetical protein